MKSFSKKFAFFSSLILLVIILGIIFVPKFLRTYHPKNFGIPDQKDNPFIAGSEKLKTCMKKTIGEKAFNDIARNKRQPTTNETKNLETCFQSERSGGKRPPVPTKDFFESDLVNPSQLSRRYPDIFICEYVSEMDLVQAVFDLERFKKAGLNTICIYLTPPKYNPHMSPNDKKEEWRTLKVKWAVGKLKKAGMAVLLDQDVGAGSQEGGRLVTSGSSDQLLAEMEKENLMWAKVAEEYKIEYLSPFGEIEDKLDWFLEKEGLTTKKRIAKTNRWLSQLLPKLKKIYKGRLIAHYGRLYPQLNPAGYDYFGSTVDVGAGSIDNPADLDKFRLMVRRAFQTALAIEEKTQSEWIIPEIFYAYEEPFVGPDIKRQYEEYGELLKNFQDDYYRITFEEIFNLAPEKRPKGLEIGNYVLDLGGYGPQTFSPMTKETRREIKKFLSQIRIQFSF